MIFFPDKMTSMLLFFFIFTFHFHLGVAQQRILQTYIVHVNLPEDHFPGRGRGRVLALERWYGSFLDGIQDQNTTQSRMVYMYRNVITGFAAKLYPHEVEEMEKREGFLHARPQEKYSLHTTRSPNFLGLYQHSGIWPASNYGKGVIIGVVDSGITPGHPSFSDKNVPPPPAKWKGKCDLDKVYCNNKLIGARNFASDEPGLPVDYDGHGTHIASIAAGNFVPDAMILDQATGTASGMAPLAHLAIYKACGRDCLSGDILAAMDTAIEDGVDVLSVSLGTELVQIYQDVIALAAFSAMKKGIFVSCSGGNSGPDRFSVSNAAPWILTVGASTIDRKMVATALLGNREEFEGQTLYQPKNPHSNFFPLIYPGIRGDKQFRNASFCVPGSLDDIDVTGKIVLCDIGATDPVEKGRVVRDAGGAGMLLVNEKINGYSTFADPHVLPATDISYTSGERIKSYINSTSSPTGIILFGGTVIGDRTAPRVTYFSSRGPNLASPGILKPDVIGPGSNILAAWPKFVDEDSRQASFTLISGTSLSCPHLSGVAALIKSLHPDWSPAMIKSAIMTSATQTNLDGARILDEESNTTADLFAIGAGHVNPTGALDPGLVYDITSEDYISYLCRTYTEKHVAIMVQRRIDCNGSSKCKGLPEAELNYPSVSLELKHRERREHSRTVTNVGDANSEYHVEIEGVSSVKVTVEPKVLKFTKARERKTYKIYFYRHTFQETESYVEGSITWVSRRHSVRIPISVKLVSWKTKAIF